MDSFAKALASIDWDQPWFYTFSPLGKSICQQIVQAPAPEQALFDVLNAHAKTLLNARNQPLRFVPQASISKETAYETTIYTHGTVPTRTNLHDFFNALIWLHFPKIKAALNQIQAHTIAQHGISSTRQRVRDLITLFDENGLLLLSHDHHFITALQNAQWHEIFLAQRHQWAKDVHIMPFGHALLEKLLCPFKAIAAHSFAVCATPEFSQDNVEDALITHIQKHQRFYPLPVMGIPGWCVENQTPSFYQDAQVFRYRTIASTKLIK